MELTKRQIYMQQYNKEYTQRPKAITSRRLRGVIRRVTKKYKKYHNQYVKTWIMKNPEKHMSYVMKWRDNNPEKHSLINKSQLIKLGLDTVDLINWGIQIKKRDKVCQICGGKAEHAHHIFYKAKYPQMALIENNGIALCKIHHSELHNWKVK